MNILGRAVRSTLLYRSAFVNSLRQYPVAVSGGAHYSTKSSKSSSSLVSNDGQSSAVRKPRQVPKITLVGPDQSVSVVNLDEAQKISKRRDLKLVKIVDLDMKTQRPVYKLMTSAEYLTEDLKRREEKKRSKQEAAIKGDKLLTVSARITEHDLTSKIQNVLKWLQKSYEVRIVISGDGDKSKQESVAVRFEANTKDAGKIVQKRFRDNDLRFQILPGSSAAPEQVPFATSGDKKKGLLDGKRTALDDTQSSREFHTERSLLA